MADFPTDLAAKLSQTTRQTKGHKTVVVPLGDGNQTRIGLGHKPFFDIWDLNWTNITNQKKETFITFFKAHGLVIPFYFTNPNGERSMYIFDTAPNMQDNGLPAPYTRYTINAKIKEVDGYIL